MTQEVVAALRDGELAIFATETLWSLSATAFDRAGAQKIFAAKQRPHGTPLAVGFSSWGMARQYVKSTPLANQLAAAFLPGPLSLILDRTDDRLSHVAPGISSLSVRVPDHPLAAEVLTRVGPCIMTSANLHGQPDPVRRADVRALFHEVPIAGESVKGRGSTVVDARGDSLVVLREGAISVARLEAAIAVAPDGTTPRRDG
jgi:L-threonylcarbamoyladenylate synthase